MRKQKHYSLHRTFFSVNFNYSLLILRIDNLLKYRTHVLIYVLFCVLGFFLQFLADCIYSQMASPNDSIVTVNIHVKSMVCKYTEVCVHFENRTMICSFVLVSAIYFVWHCVRCEWDFMCGGNPLTHAMFYYVVRLTFQKNTHAHQHRFQ